MSSLAIVPAAGKGERFGSQKLLADVGGEPLLARTVRCLLDGGVAIVVVVLPPDTSITAQVVPLLADPRVREVINPDPSRGMFSSIQTGVAVAAGDPILVLPGDMPFVRAETVAAVIAAYAETGQLVLPRHADRHGHPLALPGDLRRDILHADPTTMTLSDLVKRHAGAPFELEVPDSGILRDVDVAQDLSP